MNEFEIDVKDLSTFLNLDDTPDDMKPTEEYQEPELHHNMQDYDNDDDLMVVEDFGDFSDFDMTGSFEDEDGYVAPEVDESTVDEDDDNDTDGDVVENNVDDTNSDEGEREVSEYEVDYDTVITLPDGRDVSIEDLANGYMDGTNLSAKEEQIKAMATEFAERIEQMRDDVELCMLESDEVIKYYETFDWEGCSMTDKDAYVENREYLTKHQKRRAQLQGTYEKLQNDKRAKEEEKFQQDASRCVMALREAIPNFSADIYNGLVGYAKELGIPDERMQKEVDPAFYMTLYKAQQFDKGRAEVKAKIKKVGAPKKTLTAATAEGTKGKTDKDMMKARAAQAAENGTLSQQDMFKFLMD